MLLIIGLVQLKEIHIPDEAKVCAIVNVFFYCKCAIKIWLLEYGLVHRFCL